MKPSAADFARGYEAFLGTPYSAMDCQALVEAMLDRVGVHRDWRGSNHMFRDMQWTGSPEDCLAAFGGLPTGALLFIHAFDGGETQRGYTDGLGNASHVGVYLGPGQGAVHASSSRGLVCRSLFQEKSIPGGWNMVGLMKDLDYGLEDGTQEVMQMENAVIAADNGLPVNFRQGPSKSAGVYAQLPVDTAVTAGAAENGWCRVRYGEQTGYVMAAYVQWPTSPADSSASLQDRVTRLEEQVAELMARMGAG